MEQDSFVIGQIIPLNNTQEVIVPYRNNFSSRDNFEENKTVWLFESGEFYIEATIKKDILF